MVGSRSQSNGNKRDFTKGKKKKLAHLVTRGDKKSFRLTLPRVMTPELNFMCFIQALTSQLWLCYTTTRLSDFDGFPYKWENLAVLIKIK